MSLFDPEPTEKPAASERAPEAPEADGWRCPQHGCTAPLERHPVELARRALAERGLR